MWDYLLPTSILGTFSLTVFSFICLFIHSTNKTWLGIKALNTTHGASQKALQHVLGYGHIQHI